MPSPIRNEFQLPVCPIDRLDYEHLYAFNHGTDDFQEFDTSWQEIRIPSRATEDGVYQRLPSATDYEFGGYLTQSRIRFRPCGPLQANMPKSKACTFHSHPGDLPLADLPSIHDVYQFLAFRHLRTITVGAKWIWIWDKTRATMAIIRKLAAWSEQNHLTEVRRLEKEFPSGWQEPYMRMALQSLGLNWPNKVGELREKWQVLIRAALKIRVRMVARDAESRMQ